MDVPLAVHFHNMERSLAIEEHIREKVEKLRHFFSRYLRCQVTVERSRRHHRHGNTYRVSIDMKVPGSELVVSRDPELDHDHEDVYVAVRDAFAIARRQLVEHVDKLHGKARWHRQKAVANFP